jgi:dihydroorotase
MAGMTLRNGRWLDARGATCEGDLVVQDGRIHLGARPDPGDPVVDAQGGWVLPGAIDAHTHLREPGQEHKEGIDSGTRAALAGGVTTVLDMPNNAPPITSAATLAAKAALFRARSRVNWGLHVQAPVEDRAPLGPHVSAKVYMARSSSLPALREAEALRDTFATQRRVAIHAEDESRFLPAGHFGPRAHHLERPPEAVAAALRTIEGVLESMPPGLRPRVILCHASTQIEVEWLRRVRSTGWDVWGETCPHYLLLTEADYLREGPRLKVNPPLRTAADVEAVRRGLAEGVIDFVSSDHAPHTPEEKADEARAPSGLPGIEWFLPALLSLVDQQVLPPSRLLEVSSASAARCYQLSGRGLIADGAWADLAVVSRHRPVRPLRTRAGYDPFAHLGLEWTVDATVVSGRLAYAGGAFTDGVLGEEVAA